MRKLIVPIFSMRSYETGLYSVLKDGNFQVHLHRSKPGDVIVIPEAIADFEQLKELFPEFEYVKVPYMINAYETRKSFWKQNKLTVDNLLSEYSIDLIVTDITGYFGQTNIVFNFNITSDPDVKRPYIDEFLQTDVASVIISKRTFVLNQRQKDILIKSGAPGHKIEVCQKVINPDIMDRYVKGLCPLLLGNSIFHPFRISDKCYAFDKVVEESLKTYGTGILVTDPNDTFNRSDYPARAIIHCRKLSKQEYYQVLLGQPRIIYNENPEKVFHPGLAELIYFGAKIQCLNKLPKYNDIIIHSGEDVWLS